MVADVPHYSEFVPYCEMSRVVQKSADGRELLADMSIGFSRFSERFVAGVSRAGRWAYLDVVAVVADTDRTSSWNRARRRGTASKRALSTRYCARRPGLAEAAG